ncbi:MAG: MEDS domain-containing protein [Candidatus Omnitrophota bacterium]
MKKKIKKILDRKAIQKFKDEFRRLPLGEHLCCIYGSKDEQFSMVIPYILIGLENHQRCIYIVDDRTIKEVMEAFAQAGVDIHKYIDSKQIIFLTRSDAYLKGGFFDPDRMIVLLKKAQKQALKDGYEGLRVAGEMTWILSKLPGVERFVEYEAKLNYFFPKSKSTAICQYNEKRFSPETLLDVIYTHPTVVIHKMICKNPFYVLPDVFLARMKKNKGRVFYEKVRDELIDRTELEGKRKESQELMKGLARFPAENPSPVLRVDRSGRIMFLNRAARVLLEPWACAKGKVIPDFMKPLFSQNVKRGKMVEMEQVLGDRAFLFTTTPMRNVPYLNIYGLDITKRKKAESQVKEIADVKTRFASIASHELRANLSIIKEGVGLVFDGVVGEPNEKQKNVLKTVMNSINRLARLVNDILDFQKMVSGKQEYHFQKQNVNDVIKEIYETTHFLAEQKGLYFVLKLCEGLADCQFDKDKIIQVLVNLINNAIKFTESGGIEVFTTQESGDVHISIKDTGSGIKKEDLGMLFKSFGQLETNVGKQVKGTGLGLAISKEIVEAHKGKIWAESEMGKGTTFHLTLPL